MPGPPSSRRVAMVVNRVYVLGPVLGPVSDAADCRNVIIGLGLFSSWQEDKMSTGTCSHIGLKENHFRDFLRAEHEEQGLKMKLCCLHHRDTVTVSQSGRGPDECIRRRPPKGCGFFHFVMRFLLVSCIVTRVS